MTPLLTRGWIRFDSERRMLVSFRLRDHLPKTSVERDFFALAGAPMTDPDKNLPDPEFPGVKVSNGFSTTQVVPYWNIMNL